MAFFDQMFGGGGMAPGMGSNSPSAFTSPGMSPQLLGLLMNLQNHAAMPGMGGGAGGLPGGPMMPQPPAGLGAGGAIPRPGMPAIPPGATAGGPQQSNILQMLMGLNPQMLRSLLGSAMPAAGGSVAPGLAAGIPNSGLAGGP